MTSTEKMTKLSMAQNNMVLIAILLVLCFHGCYLQISPVPTGSTATFAVAVVSSIIAPKDPCSTGTDDCTNGFATCVANGTSYYCQCNSGLTGSGKGLNGCTDIDECAQSGTCNPNADCKNTIGNYTCTCKSGYSGDGTTCADINECLNPTICDVNANCQNSIGSYLCTCKEGFVGDFDTCIDRNECSSPGLNKCVLPATCDNTVGSYDCLCPTGYVNNGSFACQDINECDNATLHDCDANADCTNTVGTFTCACKNGFTGNGKICTDVNECETSQRCDRNANCQNQVGTYTCTCKAGYEGTGLRCTNINECTNSSTNKCGTNATCIDIPGSFICTCPSGFTKSGLYDCLDINECSTANICVANSVCENSLGSYKCICNSGYQGSNCQDIDECTNSSLNTCDANANCTNLPGSFSCKCNSGFQGSGETCTNIDECQLSNDCDTKANCIDTIGSYTCECRSGYSGNGFTCTDINECSTGVELCNQTCTNIPGSYICSCQSGYTLNPPYDCVDINECLSENLNDCHQNATCSNTVGSFTCQCNSGFLGDGIGCVVDNFTPYKSCSYITDADVGQPVIRLQDVDGIPLSGALLHDVYVCVNGFVSIGNNLCEQGATGDLGEAIGNGTIFAPYLSDIDTSIPSGVVTESNRIHYCHYDSNSNNAQATEAKAKVQETVRKVTSTSFVPKVLFSVTWFEVSPFPATFANNYFNSTNKATFQLVLTSDGVNTYVYFVYYNMKWFDPVTIFKVQVGYRYNPTQSLIPSVPQQYNRLRFDKAAGNAGEDALWLFQTSDKRNNDAALQCNTWKDSQPTVSQITSLQFSSKKILRRMSCPCCIQQAVYDSRYRYEDSILHSRVKCVYKNKGKNCGSLVGSTYCIQRKNIWYTNLQDANNDNYYVVTRCCYAADTGGLITTVSDGNSPLTQNYLKPSSLPIKTLRKQRNDLRNEVITSYYTPFTKCCTESAKCSEYQSRTRLPTCSNYKPQGKSSSYGDPHLVTLDGLSYTFNGLGDYILVNSSAGLQVHSRTSRVLKGNTPQRATVFCGFAMTESEEPVFEMYFNASLANPIFFVDGAKQDYKNSTTYGTTDVVYDNSTNDETVTFTFLSGNSIEIAITPDMLQAAVSISDDLLENTQGLLGIYNGNTSDDLTTRAGTILPETSTEQDIYDNFGQTWSVLNGENLFTEPFSDTASYTPVFFTNVNDMFNNNQTAVDVAQGICGNLTSSQACLFDLALSDNVNLAVNGKEFSTAVANIRQLISLSPPFVAGPFSLNITSNTSTTFFIQTNSTGNLTYFIETNHTAFTLINNKTGEVSFIPTTLNEEIVIGIIDDDTGLSARLQPVIYFCHCSFNGTCDYRQTEYEHGVNNPFINFYQCSCTTGYGGHHCGEVLDPCVDLPCFVNVTCSSNITGSSRMAYCDNCPDGFLGNGRKCYDIDECAVGKPCQQTCTNVVSSFICGCYEGYTKYNTTHCEDVNECNNASTCGENEKCENKIGSHVCNCASGYRRNSSNVCTDIDECAEFTDTCQQNCINTIGGYNCSCNSGFTLDVNGTTCNDVNECVPGSNNCHDNATCSNILGGFQCDCDKGFSGNGTSCEDVDECRNSQSQCNQNCINTIGSFKCTCNQGFVLSADAFTCVEKLNPCLTGTDNCDGNATCAYQAGNVTCTCNNGFIGDGTSCADINECQSANGGCSQNCVNTPGTFECQCNSGFSLDADSTTCNNINECVFGLDNCTAVGNSRCFDTAGSFGCNCNNGFEKVGDQCKDIDECATNTSGCSQNCTNTPGAFQCSCQSGYTLKQGTQCINIDECIFNTDDCHVNATCTDTIGSYNCQCRDGFSGDGRTCSNINECLNNNLCDMICVDMPGSYKCNCRSGYSLGVDGRTCTDINECVLGTSNCTTNQTCFNQPGSFICRGTCLQGNCEQLCNDTSIGYKCYCRPGYQPIAGDPNKCENINECSQPSLNTCVLESTCIDTNGSYICQCNQGFTGDGKTSCTLITTSPPYTTILPNQVKVLSGSISVYEAILNNNTVDLTDQATLTAFNDTTSQLYRDFKATFQASLFAKFEQIEGTHIEVEVLSLTVIPTGGTTFAPNTPVIQARYWVRFEESFNENTANTTARLRASIAQDGNKLTNANITATVVPASIALVDANECTTGLHRCHSNALCTNNVGSYTCACNSGYSGDGFSCKNVGGGTDTLVAVLATVAVGFLILIILLIWFLVVRRRRRQQKEIPENDSVSSVDGASWTPFPFGQLRARSMYVPTLSAGTVVPTQYRDIPVDGT